MSDAGTVAVNCELVTKVVASAVPFQFTTELETNSVPLTVSVKPDPPGAAVMGTSGWLINGTGLDCASATVLANIKQKQKENRETVRIDPPRVGCRDGSHGVSYKARAPGQISRLHNSHCVEPKSTR